MTTLTSPPAVALDPSWESPCPVWCTSALTEGEWGHSGDNVPLHAGTIGTIPLDGVLYAVLIESRGDGPPKVTLFNDGHTADGLQDITADNFLSLASVLLSRYEKVLASLYRDMAARVPETVTPVTPDVPVSLAS